MYYQRNMLYRLLDSFMRHIWLFIVSVVTILGLVFAYSALRPVKYLAGYTVVLQTDSNRSPLDSDSQEEPTWQILQTTVNQLQALVSTKRFLKTALTDENGQPVFLHIPVDLDNQDQLSALQKSITIVSDGTESFDISLTYGNPDDTTTILNGILSAYIHRDADEKTSYYSQQVAFLTSQVTDYKNKLTTAETGLANWKEAHPNGDPNSMASSQQDLDNLKQRHDELQVQIASTQERLAAVQAQLATTPKTTVSVQRMSEMNNSALQQKLDEVKAELAEDQDIKGMLPDHPVVIALKRQVALLSARIASESGAAQVSSQDLTPNVDYDNLKSQVLQSQIDLQGLQTEMADTNTRIATGATIVTTIPENEKDLAELTRNYRIYDQNYNMLLDKLEQANMNEQINRRQVASQYQILLTQQPVSQSSGKKAIELYAGGIFIALFVGIGLVLLSEWMDASLRDPVDTQKALGVPVLALLPEFGGSGAKSPLLGAPSGHDARALPPPTGTE